ncbi:MAG: hypothetical protein LBM16_02520 [Clostridiales bacterium]|nr:hypothetical protein [Clostridiales bacterium]
MKISYVHIVKTMQSDFFEGEGFATIFGTTRRVVFKIPETVQAGDLIVAFYAGKNNGSPYLEEFEQNYAGGSSSVYFYWGVRTAIDGDAGRLIVVRRSATAATPWITHVKVMSGISVPTGNYEKSSRATGASVSTSISASAGIPIGAKIMILGVALGVNDEIACSVGTKTASGFDSENGTSFALFESEYSATTTISPKITASSTVERVGIFFMALW